MQRKKLYLATFILLTALQVAAQDSTLRRIIFIGDAGEINHEQTGVIAAAADKITSNTTVFFLGDNIYPRGMGLSGKAESEGQHILQSQYKPMRSKGAGVYFLPGNHDWDKSGKKGLEKIKKQSDFLIAQNDPQLQMIPAGGCPDPVEINISDSVVVIAFDSEWWLFPHDKTNAAAGCECDSKKDVIEKMQLLFYKNRYKVILLAAHHPFQTYGTHGGYFPLKDHIFPLTNINKNLYVPLPLVGSLYPFLRKTFTSPEDLINPLYKQMVSEMDDVFEGFPNLIHIAGHEHGLQFIKNNQTQIVSGAGAKKTYVRKEKDGLFETAAAGFVTVDLLQNNSVVITYYTVKKNMATAAFTYTQPYTSIKTMEAMAYEAVKGDSIAVQANVNFDKVSKLHRNLFGENYRKEWNATTMLPLIKISAINGGLTPLQRGGGQQSRSLRLKDKDGKEWVIRSVNKYADVILPEVLRQTFAKDIVNDAMSAQHPYSALIVPVLAAAAGVPHATPVIGVIAPDSALGIYQKDFVNTVCLLEEREPMGNSDNTEKMLKALDKDNDNSFDYELFLKARLLDLLIGDWDRHEDQWRWVAQKEGKGKKYIAVPRDRDQVLHVINGNFPHIASLPWIAPKLHEFDGTIKKLNYFFTNGYKLNGRFLTTISYNDWMKITTDFVNQITDTILEKALLQLPNEAYTIRNEKLLQQLKERRNNLPAAMKAYYKFLNKKVDIQTSNKDEMVVISDAPENGLLITINKITNERAIKNTLYSKVFYPAVTKEIRLYIEKGDDSVVINNHSKIKIRIIGGKGNKTYHVAASAKKINVYGKKNNNEFTGAVIKINKHLTKDSLNTAYIPTNPYNKIIPSVKLGFNPDDGILLGGAVKFIKQGFRKQPYGSMQQLSFIHAFNNNSYKMAYHGEWLKAVGKADIMITAKASVPNGQNFFGLGNATTYNTATKIIYFRTRFSLYNIEPALRWQNNSQTSFSAGPAFQYYRLEPEHNVGRFINNAAGLHTYDSATITQNKSFAGLILTYRHDARNNNLLPVNGAFFNLKVQGYTGLNSFSKSFVQVIPEFSFYKSLDRQSAVVIANRTGAGVSMGKTAFYQSLFLGSHENLLGYRQYRFAGEQMLYNNFEARIRLAQVASYIVPGQLGLIGFYDVGKVWAEDYNSKTWHQAVGGGVYFAPAQMAVLQLVMGHSAEGWYPYFSLGFRF